MKMETYARMGSWVMNFLGIYYAWANLGSNVTGSKAGDFIQAIMWGIILCIVRYITTHYVFSKLGAKFIPSKRGKPQKVAKFATCAFKAACFAVLV
jgi:hypothetical protein